MSEHRVGDWIQIFTGRMFWPFDPRPDDICIEDVAHSLSMQCRFCGHSLHFYSVAEHSVRVSEIVPIEDALWALLHDASEAYLIDLPRPLKRHSELGRLYRAAESLVMAAVCVRFGLSVEQPASVGPADAVLLVTEARDLMSAPPQAWDVSASPLRERIAPLSPRRAEALFMRRFFEVYHAAQARQL